MIREEQLSWCSSTTLRQCRRLGAGARLQSQVLLIIAAPQLPRQIYRRLPTNGAQRSNERGTALEIANHCHTTQTPLRPPAPQTRTPVLLHLIMASACLTVSVTSAPCKTVLGAGARVGFTITAHEVYQRSSPIPPRPFSSFQPHDRTCKFLVAS